MHDVINFEHQAAHAIDEPPDEADRIAALIAVNPATPRNPLAAENFPWVLLDRALAVLADAYTLSHARRGVAVQNERNVVHVSVRIDFGTRDQDSLSMRVALRGDHPPTIDDAEVTVRKEPLLNAAP